MKNCKLGKDDKWQEESIKRLNEEAWEELIEEGLVRKEGKNYIWNHRGIIEAMKTWLKFDCSINMKGNIRKKKD